MIQSIYTSVTNADVIPDKKGQIVKSEPIPLLKDKYLGEYRTEIEKAKVRRNLGIPDENSMRWGHIEGFVEEQKDLVQYVESKWLYKNKISENITNIKEALDYVIYFVNNYKTNDESIIDLNTKFDKITLDLQTLEELLKQDIQKNSDSIIDINTDIEEINNTIEEINKDIESVNESLRTINVDENILQWVSSKLENSKSIQLSNETLDIKISEQENNSISLLDNGLFVQDYSEEINKIPILQESIDSVIDFTKYTTSLSDDSSVPNKIGGIEAGTKVSDLKGKSFVEILDTLLFPTTVRNLIQPTVTYGYIQNLVKVGSSVLKPTLTFIKGDAGEETNRIETITFNDSEFTENTYTNIGTYYYKGIVYYDAGEYLIDNKGQVTNKRIEAGSKEATTNVTTTYPWYAGNNNSVLEQILVKFGQDSGDLEFTLFGQNACIKLPGSNTIINSFKADGGMGYLDIDMDGWINSQETINGITYQVWTKQDNYESNISHKINFKLEL